MTSELKIILGIGVATIAIIVGGIFFATRPATISSGPKVDQTILVREDSQILNATSSAKAQLVEFADFQCPACGAYYLLVKQLLAELGSETSFVYRHFPLQQHINAVPAAYAAEAAGLQHKFFEMEDKLYTHQDEWSESSKPADIFLKYAKELQLDVDTFKKDMELDTIKKKIERDSQDGTTLGVNSTPTFYLNGQKLGNPQSYDDFKTLIKAAILQSPISQAPVEKYHAHANLKVVLNGKPIDFTLDKYQSKEGKELNEYVHLHDGVGDVIHLHKKGLTLGDFFTSLKISFTKECLTLDTGEKFCNTDRGSAGPHLYVNGKANESYEKYVPSDLDRILITYGSDVATEVEKQIQSVSDSACMYSEKCPERGKPPTESCVGGLGSGCE